MRLIFNLFIFLTLYQLCYGFERVKLKDVEAITFYRGRYTTGRKPIPMLTCTGLCKNSPEIVQCQNVGWDGIDAQWKCNANLDKNVKFSKISVNCEGYDHPHDSYIIAGSCGLEYELSYRDHNTATRSTDHYGTDSSSMPFWIFIGFGAIFIMLMFCKSSDESSREREGYNYHGAASAPPPEAPPSYSAYPPGFKTSYTQPNRAQSAGDSSGPGFWSGLGMGGLAGYLFSRNSSSTSPPVYTDYYRPTRSSFGHSSFQDDLYSDRSDSTYSAEGFGSTKRR